MARAPGRQKTTFGPAFGASFEVPVGWKDVMPSNCMRDGYCSVGLNPPGWNAYREQSEYEEPRYAIDVVIRKYDYDALLWNETFEKTSEGWSFSGGRMGQGGGVSTVRGRGWTGLRASANTGVYAKNGGYCGDGGTFVETVLTNGRGWCATVMLYDTRYEDAYRRLLGTFRFADFTYGL